MNMLNSIKHVTVSELTDMVETIVHVNSESYRS